MMKNTFKEKTASRKIALTLAIIALVLSAYLWYAVLLPQRDLISQLKNECEDRRQYVVQVSSFARQRPDYENYLKELDKKLASLSSMLPNSPALSEFLQDMESFAGEAGVAVVDIKPLPAVAKGQWRELPIEIIVTGNFEELIEFSKRIEGSRRFVSLTAATISRESSGQDTKTPSEPELTSKISLVIYYK